MPSAISRLVAGAAAEIAQAATQPAARVEGAQGVNPQRPSEPAIVRISQESAARSSTTASEKGRDRTPQIPKRVESVYGAIANKRVKPDARSSQEALAEGDLRYGGDGEKSKSDEIV